MTMIDGGKDRGNAICILCIKSTLLLFGSLPREAFELPDKMSMVVVSAINGGEKDALSGLLQQLMCMPESDDRTENFRRYSNGGFKLPFELPLAQANFIQQFSDRQTSIILLN